MEPMTPEEFRKKMEVLASTRDAEGCHKLADDLLCEILESWGYGDGVAIFREMEKWYA